MSRTAIGLLALLALFTGCASRPLSTEPAAAPEAKAAPVAEAPVASPVATAPAVGIAPDGFPTGSSTPEGAACDLARAFIQFDAAMFKATCYTPRGGAAEYSAFLNETSSQMSQLKAMPENERPNGPTTIARVYKARHFSKSGNASAGYAMFDLHGVQFVDVFTAERAGNEFECRTLVFQLPDGTWRVMPRPDLMPMVCKGLMEEPRSTELWAK
jgi:hypothetical protein